MRKNLYIILASILSLHAAGQTNIDSSLSSHEKVLKQIKTEVNANLTENILPFWSAKMLDTINGGFYGRIDGNEKLKPESYKGGHKRLQEKP